MPIRLRRRVMVRHHASPPATTQRRLPSSCLAGLLVCQVGFVLLLPPAALEAQKVPKIDSLLVELPVPKPAAMDLVLNAFISAGLEVTDNSGSMVESDQGGNRNMLGLRFTRVVRALVTARDSASTRILLTGIEVRLNERDDPFTRLRIDNKAGGAGEKLWCKMVSMASALDSTQVPDAAKKPDKCGTT